MRLLQHPRDVRGELKRRYEAGELSSAEFPLTLKIKVPSAKDVASNLAAALEHAQSWRNAFGQHLSFTQVSPQRYNIGVQHLPSGVTFDTLEEALRAGGLLQDYRLVQKLTEFIAKRCPKLSGFAQENRGLLIEYKDVWPQLLSMLEFLEKHPKPNIYLRQAAAPGVDTKFIEKHTKILNRILTIALPPEAINSDISGAGISAFCRRFGFKEKPVPIRMRFLDPALSKKYFPFGIEFFEFDAAGVKNFNPEIKRVIIAENEITFLSLPVLPDTLAIFGTGYGVNALKDIPWLEGKCLAYFGDIDRDGFKILSLLRSVLEPLPVTSLLMDLETLKANLKRCVEDKGSPPANLQHLTASEQETYEALCSHALGKNLRLEQELISFETVCSALHQWAGIKCAA